MELGKQSVVNTGHKSTAKVSLGGIRISQQSFDSLRADAIRFRKTQAGVLESALRMIMALKPAERAEWYKTAPAKITGRKLTP